MGNIILHCQYFIVCFFVHICFQTKLVLVVDIRSIIRGMLLVMLTLLSFLEYFCSCIIRKNL